MAKTAEDTMYAIIGHHFWDRPGGGELVMASIAVGLEKDGYTPILTSLTKFDKKKYIEWFGIDISKYQDISLNIKVKILGLYMRLIVWIPIKKAIQRYKPAFTVIDMPTYKPIEKKTTIYEYIHFPLDLTFNPRYRDLGFYYTQDPYTAERYSKFPMNIYAEIFRRFYRLYARENPFYSAQKVLTNSRWTAGLVKKAFGEEPEVLNPPLPPTVQLDENPPGYDERERAVAMLGRFSQEKRYHWVLGKIAPRLAKEAPDTKIIIMGDASTPSSRLYYEQLLSQITKMNLKNVVLLRSPSRQVIKETLKKSMLFLHATINEHWGIAVAEAMAHGTPPVVHKSGGAWTDLAEEGKTGLGYTNEEEAIEEITDTLSNRKKWRYYSQKSIEKAKELTFQNFIKKVQEIW
jgi:glycosyltransferase involved in cell wall biosynthesis